MTRPTVSVIIPVLDDHAALDRLASRLAIQTRQPEEVIVVTGSSSTQVAEVAAMYGFSIVRTAANRGLQLDSGARAATSDVLWFVHADSEPPATAVEHIVSAVSGGATSGCFRFRFQGARTLLKFVIEKLVAARIQCGGIAYGDQALFCTRDAYHTIGGYPHEPLFEEVRFVRQMRKQFNFVSLDLPIVVSTRRWDRDGWIRRCCHNRWLAICYGFGIPTRRLSAAYRSSATQEEPRG